MTESYTKRPLFVTVQLLPLLQYELRIGICDRLFEIENEIAVEIKFEISLKSSSPWQIPEFPFSGV